MNESTRGNSLSRINPVIWPALALFLGWAVLISQLRHHWGGQSYYNFGWFVPFLTLWLLYKNLQSLRPTSEKAGKKVLFAAIGSMLLVLPFHALSEVNPFWRVPLWGQACGLFAYSLCIIYSIYGKPGIRASLFPLFFLMTMIPWPYRFEVIIIQALTKVVVALSLQGIHLLGYPVELAGNSFVLGELQIGVNEACSGIRSLQALFMVTLFLGSLFGQDRLRRLLAVALLPLIVIVINSIRAIFLSLQVIVNGDSAYQAWHDPAGYIAFGVSMVLIYACIEILNIGGRDNDSIPVKPPMEFLNQFKLLRGGRLFGVFIALPLLTYSIVESWFLIHEINATPQPGWEFRLPEASDPAVTYAEIHPQVEGLLGYSYGHRFFYRLSQKEALELYYYGYEPDNRLASVSSYGHSPAICMESVGATMVREFPDLLIEVDGIKLPLKHYLFRLSRTDQVLDVFWIVWEKRNMGIDPEDLASLGARTQWTQLMLGRRDFSRKVVLLSVNGVEGEKRVRDTVKRMLTQWIQLRND